MIFQNAMGMDRFFFWLFGSHCWRFDSLCQVLVVSRVLLASSWCAFVLESLACRHYSSCLVVFLHKDAKQPQHVTRLKMTANTHENIIAFPFRHQPGFSEMPSCLNTL